MTRIHLLPLLAGIALTASACNRETATETTTTTTTSATSMSYSAASSVAAVSPSFDCNRALPGAEAAVCATPNLAQLDNELTRLYAVVDTGTGISDAERVTLRRLQDGWKQKRDACAETVDVNGCLAAAYTTRIADIRSGYALARADKAGISSGPVSWRCPGKTEVMTSTFVNTTTPLVHLHRDNSSVVLTGAVAASGARYQASTPDGAYEFWNKGTETAFTVPGASSVTCTLADTAAG